MSEYNRQGDDIPTEPLPDLVVKTSAASSLTLITALAFFLVLTGFSPVLSLPSAVAGPAGPIQAALGPQGGTTTPDPSDEGTTGPQGLLGSNGLALQDLRVNQAQLVKQDQLALSV